jgi:O-antigen/teichoic acid export membrane protein
MKSFSADAAPQPTPPRSQERLKRKFAWGILDQVVSSATNFGLSLVAGRLLGASGLGVIAIGFSAYLIVLGFHRALVSEPLIVVSVTDAEAERRATRSSISATAGLGLASAVIVALVGLWIGGPIGRGLLIFAPWVLPALLQDLWRMLLFRGEKGGAATANDAIWLITMAALLTTSHGFRADWTIVACWGLGATASAIVGFAQLRLRAGRPRTSWNWLIREAWPVGRWFATEGIVYTAASQGVVFLLAALIDTAAAGGLRSVQVIFAPLSLLGPAAALPGLPLLSKAIRESHATAWILAFKLSIVLFLLTAGYLVATSVNGSELLAAVFGDDFLKYRELILPVGVHQLVLAAGGGYYLLLKAHRGGKWILLSRTLSSLVTVALVAWMSLRYEILGGAWAIALGASIGTASIIAFASRANRIGRVEGRP